MTRNANTARRTAPWFMVLLVFLVAAGGYLALPSSRYNSDGLRAFPGLIQVEVDSRAQTSYVPKSWRAGYQVPYYSRANVQMHFLFPLYWAADYRLARSLGLEPTGVRGLQVANAVSAAFAVGLFALLVGLLTRRAWTVLATGFGLAFSTAFSSMATNIAEVVPALPWLILALILLVTEDDLRPARTVCAGLLLGISAAFYFASAAVGAAVAVSLALRKPRAALLLAGTLAVTVGATYVLVLLLAGYHTLPQLGRALFFVSEQGNYGGLRLSNLVSVWLGFAGSIFPVLPDNFGGLRSLLARSGAGCQYLRSVVAIPLVVLLGLALFAALFHARRRLEARARRTVVLGLAIFLAALTVSLFWDPYHPKFWVYSNVGLWLMIAGYLAHVLKSRDPDATTPAARRLPPALIALALLCAVSTNLARRVADAGANPRWQTTQSVARIVNTEPGSVVLGGWEDEFDYLALLVPESSQMSLPDVILEQGCDSTRFAGLVAGRLAAAQDKARGVYFLNLFNQSPAELDAFYSRRLRLPQFITWLDSYRPGAQLVWQDSHTGAALYKLTADR